MAERRMFSKAILDSDLFLEMPPLSQLLYVHLSMRADDDGFVNNPRAIMNMVNCRDNDMRVLISEEFIIPFESGVVVVKHWRVHNYIQKDRYNPTRCKVEKSMLALDENKAYRYQSSLDTGCIQNVSIMHPECIQSVSTMDTQVRLGKVRKGKERIEECSIGDEHAQFSPPSLEEVQEYCKERNSNIDAAKWHDFYTCNGWMFGKYKMIDWKAAVRYWERGENSGENTNRTKAASSGKCNHKERDLSQFDYIPKGDIDDSGLM